MAPARTRTQLSARSHRSLKAAALVTLGLALSPSGPAHAQPAPDAPTRPRLVPPRLLREAEVPYPAGATGDANVLLIITVNPDGTVRQVKATEENEPFSSVAIAQARSFRFSPATRDGTPVAAIIRMEMRFTAPVEVPPPAPPGPAAPPDAPAPGVAASATGPAAPPPPAPAAASQAGGVLIKGDRPEPGRSATLTRAEVRQIPGAFGDPFRAIEILPGVTPIVSGLPFFFIRGAPPGNVGYFLDGIRVPLLYHIGVGPSVIHPGIIERVDLYPGGYPARFGRFAGGIVAGETMPPKPELHGEGNIRLFDAGALVESPFADGRGTALVAGRYSYTAALLSVASPGVSLSYWDYQARISYDLTPRDRVTVFSFGSYDYLGQTVDGVTSTVFGTEFHRVDMRYDHALGNRGNARVAVMLGLDQTLLDEQRHLRDRLLGVRTDIVYKVADGAVLRIGSDANVDSYDVVLKGSGSDPGTTSSLSTLFPTRQDIAMGVRGDMILAVAPTLDVTPGVRVDFYGSQGATAVAVDPRLAARLALTDHVRLLEATGIAHQPPAFVIPVPGFQPGGLRGGLQTALQESLGLEVDVDDSTTATATVFHNVFFNMSDALGSRSPQISGCPPGSFPAESLPGDPGGQSNRNRCVNERFKAGEIGSDGGRGGGGSQEAIRTLEARTMGNAYGLELMLKRRLTRRLGGFLSYTLSRSTRSVGSRTFVAAFDRTHVANAALAFDLGRNWRAGSRLVFYTGLPAAADPSSTDPPSRLPSFYRIDLRLEKRWSFARDAWISFVAEWMNVTLHKEAIATTCTLQGCQSQTIGPITIPSIGVEGGFLPHEAPPLSLVSPLPRRCRPALAPGPGLLQRPLDPRAPPACGVRPGLPGRRGRARPPRDHPHRLQPRPPGRARR
jgi:hypothetical protein